MNRIQARSSRTGASGRSRRQALLITIGAITLLPPPALGDDLRRSDKLRVLYSNQFSFDRRGVPLVTVRVAQGSAEAIIESAAPLRVLPDGEGGAEILGGRRWRVKLLEGRPGRAEHFVIIAREPFAALPRLRQEMARWQARGLRCQLIEIGAVFGVKGAVFDNRAYVLGEGPFASREAALRRAEELHRQGQLPRVAVLPQLRERPSATLEASDLNTTMRVRARDAIWFAPAQGERLSLQAGTSSGSYWGQITFTVELDGTMAAVNAVPADRLLMGLVPAEIFPAAPTAALQAQAVAARGELLAKIGTQHIADPYLLCATQHCQVYAGAGKEHPRTSAAVSSTRGRILLRPDGGLVDTVYSASCGGHTEHNDQVWPVSPDPQLRGHLDAETSAPGLEPFGRGIGEKEIARWLALRPRTYCGRSRYNQDKLRWTVRLTGARVNELTRHLGVGPVQAIQVLRRGHSGRVNLLRVAGTSAREIRGELTIRKLFGGLRSSMFTVQETRSAGGTSDFVFTGGGWGHGVGMCQTGAIGMAELKKGYQEILQHYYRGSVLKQLY